MIDAWGEVTPAGVVDDYTLDLEALRKAMKATEESVGENEETTKQEITTPSDSEPGQSRIAFASNRDGNYEIYVMNADGSNQTRLTKSSADDRHPQWSPDGERIAFGSYDGEESSVWTMNADGTDQARLAVGYSPRWSPDGNHIAFHLNVWAPGDCFLAVMNTDGSNIKGFVNLSEIGNNYPSLEWSPDGEKIAFDAGGGFSIHIYLVNANGSDLRNLTNGPGSQTCFAWSPDSKRIAFHSENGGIQVHVIDADGTGQTRLGPGGCPAWSPDGERMAFSGGGCREGICDGIGVGSVDGTNWEMVTTTTPPIRDGQPIWSHDGKRIAFLRWECPKNAECSSEICIMNGDGSDPCRLTDNTADDNDPAWSPRR